MCNAVKKVKMVYEKQLKNRGEKKYAETYLLNLLKIVVGSSLNGIWKRKIFCVIIHLRHMKEVYSKIIVRM